MPHDFEAVVLVAVVFCEVGRATDELIAAKVNAVQWYAFMMFEGRHMAANMSAAWQHVSFKYCCKCWMITADVLVLQLLQLEFAKQRAEVHQLASSAVMSMMTLQCRLKHCWCFGQNIRDCVQNSRGEQKHTHQHIDDIT